MPQDAHNKRTKSYKGLCSGNSHRVPLPLHKNKDANSAEHQEGDLAGLGREHGMGLAFVLNAENRSIEAGSG